MRSGDCHSVDANCERLFTVYVCLHLSDIAHIKPTIYSVKVLQGRA
jgi:hypothetical protein